MRECFLKGHGDCKGALTGEHFISKSLLRLLTKNNTVQIGGLPWQPKNKLQIFGINAVVANILCEGHNSKLSKLDDEGVKLFKAIYAADKKPHSTPAHILLDGLEVERWFLKIICGAIAGVEWGNHTIDESWKKILAGDNWPYGCGLFLPLRNETQLFSQDFAFQGLTDPETKELVVVWFHVAGIEFYLILKTPAEGTTPRGILRPRGITIANEKATKQIEFKWPHWTDRSVYYTKIATATEDQRRNFGFE